MEDVFKIGDVVFVAIKNGTQKQVVCPDCCGTGQLTVIMGDKSAVSVECTLCTKGYLGPQGYLDTYDYSPSVEKKTILGVSQLSGRKPYYEFHNFYSSEDNCVFSTEAEAQIRAVQMAEEQNAQEIKKINRKEKDTRSWAWNANYHRAEIRRAEKNIIYHTSKLNIAKLKAKEEKAA